MLSFGRSTIGLVLLLVLLQASSTVMSDVPIVRWEQAEEGGETETRVKTEKAVLHGSF